MSTVTEVSRLATVKGFREPAPADPRAELATMEADGQDDPHECRACHEEPEVHAERFGFNCSRCHTLEAWKPALLLRHTFVIENADKTEKTITSTMIDYGIPHGDSSMARTVSLPLGIGVKLMAQGNIDLTGVQIPIKKEIYEPVLSGLEKLNIKMVEKTV